MVVPISSSGNIPLIDIRIGLSKVMVFLIILKETHFMSSIIVREISNCKLLCGFILYVLDLFKFY